MDKRGKSSPSNPSQNSFMQQSERKPSRTRSPRGKSPSGRMSRWPCKDYLRGTCNNSFCERWHPPECLFYKNKNGCRFGEKCSFAHRQVDAQPTKWSKSNNDKSAVALLKKGDWHERGSVTDRSHDRSGKPDKRSDKKLERKSSQRRLSDARQLGCVFQDMTPPKSILRKSTDMPKPIQRVKFKKAIARQTKIPDQNPRSVTFVQVNLMSVAPMLQNLRIVHKKRQNGKSKVPAKQRGSWPKMCSNQRSMKEQHSSRLRKIGACLHQR